MNGRTEMTAGLAAIINGIFVVLNGTGILHVTPEIVSGLNGILIPIAIYFLGNRVTRVEDKADTAAIRADTAATKAAATNATINKIEAKVDQKI